MQHRRIQVVPGLQKDGKMTEKHPFVELFLAKMPRISPQEGRKPPVEAWWRKGIKEKTVNDILGLSACLDEFQSECIFALAALKVLNHPENPKHFAFWGKEPAPKTAERVQRVLGESQSGFHRLPASHALLRRALTLSDRVARWVAGHPREPLARRWPPVIAFPHEKRRKESGQRYAPP